MKRCAGGTTSEASTQPVSVDRGNIAHHIISQRERERERATTMSVLICNLDKIERRLGGLNICMMENVENE